MAQGEQGRCLSAVEEVGRLCMLIESSAKVESVVSAMVASLCAITGCSRGVVYLVSDAGRSLILQTETFEEALGGVSSRPPTEESSSIFGRLLPKEIDIDSWEDPFSGSVGSLTTDTLVHIPLMQESNIYGLFLGESLHGSVTRTLEDDEFLQLVVSLLQIYRQRTTLQRALEANRIVMKVQSVMSAEVVDNRPLRQIVSRLARECGYPVILEDRLLRALAVAEPDITNTASLGRYAVKDGTKRSLLVTEFLQTLVRTGSVKPPPESLKGFPRDRLMMAVVAASRHLGFLSFAGPASSFREVDHSMLRVGATAVALKMLYEKIALDVEENIKQDFLCNVVTNNYTTEQAIVEKANYLGYDITLPFKVIVIAWINLEGNIAETIPAPLVADIKQKVKIWSPRSIVGSFRNIDLFVLVDNNGELGPQEIAERVIGSAKNYIDAPYCCGIGKLAQRPRDIKSSFMQAKETMAILQQMMKYNSIETYDNLGAYSVLLGVRSLNELEGFAFEILDDLIVYDKEKKGELLRTLTAFVTEKGSHEEIAKGLYIHVNTLKYRIQKIQELLGVSLDDPEERFNVQLAIKALRVTKACRNWG